MAIRIFKRLRDLLDVDASSIGDGKVPVYRTSSGKHEYEDLATQVDLDAHLNDTVDAHDASAISFTPAGTVAATDVQAAIAEVASEASSSAFAVAMAVAL